VSNSIVLNATGCALVSATPGTFIAPLDTLSPPEGGRGPGPTPSPHSLTFTPSTLEVKHSQKFMQAGVGVTDPFGAPAPGPGYHVVSFPYAFHSVPVVTVTPVASSLAVVMQVSAVTRTQFTARAVNVANSSSFAGQAFNWVAVTL
jgi:hypothetical protein